MQRGIVPLIAFGARDREEGGRGGSYFHINGFYSLPFKLVVHFSARGTFCVKQAC